MQAWKAKTVDWIVKGDGKADFAAMIVAAGFSGKTMRSDILDSLITNFGEVEPLGDKAVISENGLIFGLQ